MTSDDEMEQDEGRDSPPIRELEDFALPPDHGFAARVARAIDRRETGAGLVGLSLSGFLLLLQEFFKIAMAFARVDPGTQEEE